MSRLIQARSSLSKLHTLAVSRSCRFLSTESTGINGGSRIEEAETVNVPPPPSEKLLVFGGNGFVGSHICKEALIHGLSVASMSRSGRSSINEAWADRVTWHQGDLFSPETIKDALDGVSSFPVFTQCTSSCIIVILLYKCTSAFHSTPVLYSIEVLT
ncbi:uncharacterized protein LOC110691285 [Chenopodium quinoa]|uniref:uncharacterized protein LOC110691285 n=1 Tax=Chenopodium quinoa TaxID=63459 RepID=UPI000B782BCC|nr:uncharacterized protein LOC110691285 [Chenopodium quinoa]